MGLSSRFFVHARNCDGPDCVDDHAEAERIERRKRWQRWIAAGLIFCLGGFSAEARELRIAYLHSELSRDGPGLLLRDILSENDPQRQEPPSEQEPYIRAERQIIFRLPKSQAVVFSIHSYVVAAQSDA